MLKQMSSQLSNEAKDNIDGNKQNESKYISMSVLIL